MTPVTLKVNATEPATGKFPTALEPFMEAVTERTDGKVKFEVFLSNSLLETAEHISGTAAGVADATNLNPANFGSEIPVNFWLGDVISTSTEGDFLTEFFAGTGAAVELGGLEQVETELNERGLTMLTNMYTPGAKLACTKPVAGKTDLNGWNGAGFGTLASSEIGALGMTSVTVTVPEMYEALQLGVIDCMRVSASAMKDFGLFEVAPYFADLPFSGNTQLFALSKNVWDGLPEEARDIINEELAAFHKANMAVNIESTLAAVGPGSPATITAMDELPELTQTLLDFRQAANSEFLSNPPAGFPGTEADFEAQFADVVDKWTDFVGGLTFDADGGADANSEAIDAFVDELYS